MNLLKFLDPDIIFSKHSDKKIKLIILTAYALSIFWFFTSGLPWYLMLICFYSSVLILRLGAEIGYHRYFAHRSFETTKLKKYLLLFLGSILGVGSCLSWVAVHRTHHRFSDLDNDPHSPKNIGILRVWFTFWDNNWHVDPAIIKDMLRDPYQMFIHKNYFKLLIAWITLLVSGSMLTESMVPIMIGFILPCATTSFFSGITNSLGHTVGYRNFETNDSSTNHLFIRWLFVIVGLHNNHHYKPTAWNFNLLNRWWEFDLDAVIIKHFFIKKLYV
jgi:stearoyl-CoA desaturase (delta-9 desaturase)